MEPFAASEVCCVCRGPTQTDTVRQDGKRFCSRACEHVEVSFGLGKQLVYETCVVCGSPLTGKNRSACSEACAYHIQKVKALYTYYRHKELRASTEPTVKQPRQRREVVHKGPQSTCIVCDSPCTAKYCSDECRRYERGLDRRGRERRSLAVSSSDLFDNFRPTEEQWITMWDSCSRLGLIDLAYEVEHVILEANTLRGTVDRVNWIVNTTYGPEEPFALHNLGLVRHPKSAFDKDASEKNHQSTEPQ